MITKALSHLDARTRRGPMPDAVTAAAFLTEQRNDAVPDPGSHAEFCGGIRLSNGTFKTTSPHRLDDLNTAIGQALPAQRPLRIKDLAISSGITTLEWIEDLRRREIAFRMTATDATVWATLVEVSRDLRVLLDADGEVLQYDLGGRAMRPDQLGRRERVLYGPVLQPARRLARWRVRTGREVSARRLSTSEVDLVSPALRGEPGVAVVQEDLLRPVTSGPWDVIRAANILNRSYFSEPTLRAMVSSIGARLAHNGLLAVCRTHASGNNHATVFRRGAEGAYEVAARLGDGSEIEDLIMHLDTAG